MEEEEFDSTDSRDENLESTEEASPDEPVEEYVPQHVLDGGRDYRVEGNDVSGYIGVDPEYMTYANLGEKPILTDDEKWDYTNQLNHLEGNADVESTGDANGDAVPVDKTEVDSSGGSESSDSVVVTDQPPVDPDAPVVTEDSSGNSDTEVRPLFGEID